MKIKKSNKNKEITRLLEKLEKIDNQLLRCFDVYDLPRKYFRVKWKSWLLIKIFGKNCIDEDLALKFANSYDEIIGWNNLSFWDMLCYTNNENFINLIKYRDKELKNDVDDVIDALGYIVRNKIHSCNHNILKEHKVGGDVHISFNHCNKQVLKIFATKACTEITFSDDIGEKIMRPDLGNVSVVDIVFSVFKRLGLVNKEDYPRNKAILNNIEKIDTIIKNYCKGLRNSKERKRISYYLDDKLYFWAFMHIFKSSTHCDVIMDEIKNNMTPNQADVTFFTDEDLRIMRTTPFPWLRVKSLIEEIHSHLSPWVKEYINDMFYDKTESNSYFQEYYRLKNVEKHTFEVYLKNIFDDGCSSYIIVNVSNISGEQCDDLRFYFTESLDSDIEERFGNGIPHITCNLKEAFERILEKTEKVKKIKITREDEEEDW